MCEIQSKNFIEEIIETSLRIGSCNEVITRFPPEPNGYLHIGHAKAICLNFGLAEKYNGKCNLRYDDTNPIKEDEEYINAIKRDIAWLGFKWDNECYGSDYFEYMYEKAVVLIKKGLAYVDDLSPEEMKQMRGTLTEKGKDSPYRQRGVEENLALFEGMKNGEFDEGQKVLRAKISMTSPNLNLRDPAIYRIIKTPHHRCGTDWVIYPMYDFAHPLEDAVEGITHSICTMEFEAHRPLYQWVVKNCDCSHIPRQYEFARLNVSNTMMSKRFLKILVDAKIVNGWDDPRMPTIVGLKRRGYTPASIRDFCNRIGVAKAISEVDVRLLEHCVREDLNANAKRVMGVLKPLKLTISNYPEGKTELLTAQDKPNSEETHDMVFSKHLYIEQEDFLEIKPNKKYFRLYLGGEVRLKYAYIITCTDIVKDSMGNITEVICTYDESTKSGGENSGKKIKGTLHWVEESTAVKAKVNIFDYLFVKDKNGDRVENFSTLEVLENVLIEQEITKAQQGEQFQFMRQGYFVLDNKEQCIFNKIVALKENTSWK